MWNKMERSTVPTPDDFSEYVRNPLWDRFCDFMKGEYGTAPTFEYSGCSLPGWNVKFKKSGRNLCTLYPYEGYFSVMIVIGKKEKERFEALLPSLSPYMQDLYHHTDEGMGQRWLIIELEDESLFEDIKRAIAVRRGAPWQS